MRARHAPLVLLLASCAPAQVHSTAPHWSHEGAAGPAHWAELAPDFRACAAGTRQSPVDLASPGGRAAAEYRFAYRPLVATLRHDGHTVQVDVPAGSRAVLAGEPYELLQYHFHAPAEHTIEGERHPLELHLVHRGARGLAVVGVLIRAGAANPEYAPLVDALPAAPGDARTLPAAHDPTALMASADFLRYDGSLTTPPCREGVAWHVQAAPVELSAEQIEAFRRVLGRNSRPVQPLNGRVIVRAGPAG